LAFKALHLHNLKRFQQSPIQHKDFLKYSSFLFFQCHKKWNCPRRLNIDPPCRLNIDPEPVAAF
jgi:hypothetical protein